MYINDIHVQKCISDFCLLLQYKQRKVASYISSCFIMMGSVFAHRVSLLGSAEFIFLFCLSSFGVFDPV